MLAWIVAVAAFGAVAEPFGFEDAPGDTTQQGQPFEDEVSGALDVLGAGVAESDEALAFWMELSDLEAIHAHDEEANYHVQYALSFLADGRAYSMRAGYSGEERRLVPHDLAGVNDGWSFQIHDQQADTWPQTQGEVDGDVLRWHVDPADLATELGGDLSDWSFSVWASYEHDDQQQDNGGGVGGYIIGEGAYLPPEPPLPPVPELAGDAPFVILDEAGDVESDGAPYDGADAATVDLRGFAIHEQDGHLMGALVVEDLDTVPDFDDGERYHVQFAVSFTTPADDTYSFRATYRGAGMGAEPGWTFNLHDQTADEWPDVVGRIEDDTILWAVPLHMVSASEGDLLTDWHASSWSAYEELAQRNDWASGHATYTVASDGTAAQPVDEAPDEATFEDIPGPALPLLAAGLLVLVRRRR